MSKSLAPSRSSISGWVSGDRCPPADSILGEHCFYSQCLVLAGKWLFKAQMQWSCFIFVLSFPVIFSRHEQQVEWADCESSVTCMEGSVRLDMSCGCTWSTTTMGVAGWAEPAGQLGCSQAGLWAWEVGETCKGDVCVGEGLCIVLLESRDLTPFWTLGRFFTYMWGNAATNSEIV